MSELLRLSGRHPLFTIRLESRIASMSHRSKISLRAGREWCLLAAAAVGQVASTFLLAGKRIWTSVAEGS